MDPKSYEQASVPVALVEKLGYLIPNLKCWVVWYKEKAIGVTLPSHVTLKVIESPNEVAGNRINAPKKTVKLETGVEVQVPLFIKVGESITLDTETDAYLSRAQ